MYSRESDEQQYTRPILLIGLEGWIDAGFGAANAYAAFNESVPTKLVANFDSNNLLDMRSRRPGVRLIDGVIDDIIWPQIELRAGNDVNGSDVVILTGPEPDMQWPTFTTAVVELATAMDVSMAVALGAFPAPVPHTRPMTVVSSATNAELAQEVGFVAGTIEVPAGIQAVLERSLGDAGIPSVGLWARVSHYVAGMPYPAASVALLEQLQKISGVTVDTTELQAAAAETNNRVNELIANSPEHAAMVAELEQQLEAEQAQLADFANLPSGDEIADELQRFLRAQGQPPEKDQ